MAHSRAVALTVHKGATLAFDVIYTADDGTPVSGLDTANAEIRFSPGAETAPLAGSITAATGTISFSVPPATTAAWTSSAGIGFQVWIEYADGTVEMMLEGTIDAKEAYPDA